MRQFRGALPIDLSGLKCLDHGRHQLLEQAVVQAVADARQSQGAGDRLLVEFLQRLAEHPHLFRRTQSIDHAVGGKCLALLQSRQGTVSTPMSSRI